MSKKLINSPEPDNVSKTIFMSTAAEKACTESPRYITPSQTSKIANLLDLPLLKGTSSNLKDIYGLPNASDYQLLVEQLNTKAIRFNINNIPVNHFLEGSDNTLCDLSSPSNLTTPTNKLHKFGSPCVGNIGSNQTDIGMTRGSPPRDLSMYEIIRPRDLPFITGLSRTTCWRLSRDPSSGFPPKIRLSAGAVGFSKQAIEDWLKSREGL